MMSAAGTMNARAWGRQLTAFSYRNASDLFPAEKAVIAALDGGLGKSRVLDIGIGTGRTTGHLAPRCRGYIGVDYSPEMIRRAKERFPAADLRVADARDLKAFGAAAFDLVNFSYNGIDYVDHEDRLEILRQIHAIVKPGGAFMFSAHRLGVKVPAAASVANLAVSMNPLRTAGNVVKYLQGICNSHRVKQCERHEEHYALLNDSAQQYQLLTYYIAPAAQKRQLEQAGFEQVRSFVQSGEEVALTALSDTALSQAFPADDYMVHYLARRP